MTKVDLAGYAIQTALCVSTWVGTWMLTRKINRLNQLREELAEMNARKEERYQQVLSVARKEYDEAEQRLQDRIDAFYAENGVSMPLGTMHMKRAKPS